MSGQPLAEWGFNLRRVGLGLALAAAFAVVIFVPMYLLADASPAPTTALGTFDVVAILAQHLLVIGTTQEILYRGFLMGFLRTQWRLRAWILAIRRHRR